MDQNSPVTLECLSNSIVRPSVERPLKKLYRGEPMALGITQILIGILQIAFGLVVAVAEHIHRPYGGAHIMSPYWLGIPYIISGSLSVAAAKNPKIQLVKGMLGMNVVSAVAAGVAIVMVSASLDHRKYFYSCYRHGDLTPEDCRELMALSYGPMISTTAILLMFTLLEFLISIVSAAFGCASLCRNAYSETTVVIFQNKDQGPPPVVLTPVKEDEVP